MFLENEGGDSGRMRGGHAGSGKKDVSRIKAGGVQGVEGTEIHRPPPRGTDERAGGDDVGLDHGEDSAIEVIGKRRLTSSR